MKMNKKILATAAIVLPLSVGAGSALAYFTANVEASGGAMIEAGTNTNLVEDFSDWTKHITISNSADGGAVWIRARAFSGEKFGLEYSGEGWTVGDGGYYYYGSVLEPGASAPVLDVTITGVSEDEKEDFNVIVIYERTPVEYETVNGETKAKPADWSKAVKKEETLKPANPEPGEQQAETSGSETGTETP